MDRSRVGLLLAAIGACLMFSSVAIELAAGTEQAIDDQAIFTGGGDQPWVVVVVPMGRGFVVVQGSIAPDVDAFRFWIVEADEAHRVVDSSLPRSEAYVAQHGNEFGVGFSREARDSTGFAVVWKATRPLDAEELASLDASLADGDCCVTGSVHSWGEDIGTRDFLALLAWTAGGLGVLANLIGIAMWWRSSPPSAPGPTGLLQVLDRSRDYVMQLHRIASFAMALVAAVAVTAVAAIGLRAAGQSGVQDFVPDAWLMIATVAALSFPALWMLRLRRATARELERLANLDAESPL